MLMNHTLDILLGVPRMWAKFSGSPWGFLPNAERVISTTMPPSFEPQHPNDCFLDNPEGFSTYKALAGGVEDRTRLCRVLLRRHPWWRQMGQRGARVRTTIRLFSLPEFLQIAGLAELLCGLVSLQKRVRSSARKKRKISCYGRNILLSWGRRKNPLLGRDVVSRGPLDTSPTGVRRGWIGCACFFVRWDSDATLSNGLKTERIRHTIPVLTCELVDWPPRILSAFANST